MALSNSLQILRIVGRRNGVNEARLRHLTSRIGFKGAVACLLPSDFIIQNYLFDGEHFGKVSESPAVMAYVVYPAVFFVMASRTFFDLGSHDAFDFLAASLPVSCTLEADVLLLDEFPSGLHHVHYRNVNAHDFFFT